MKATAGEALDVRPGEAHGQRGLEKSQCLPLKVATTFVIKQIKRRCSPVL